MLRTFQMLLVNIGTGAQVLISKHILKPTANRSPYIFTLVQKVKHRVYKIQVFLNDFAETLQVISFKNDVYFLHGRS